MGTLSVLAESSSVSLGSGGHVLSFVGLGTLDYKTLTILGWEGTAGASGTAGVLRIGSSLFFTRAQLDQFKFTYNSGTYSSKQLSDGELVPDVLGNTGYVNIRITSGSTTSNGSWSPALGTLNTNYTFTPSGNNATINVAELYSILYNYYSNVTITTTLAAGSQAGQVDIGAAITGDLNSNRNRTLTINAGSDINVSQSITLTNSATSNLYYSTHSLSMTSTNGNINIYAAIKTQNPGINWGASLIDNYNPYSGSITLSALSGAISTTSAGTLNANGTVNSATTGSYDGGSGAITLTAKNIAIVSTVSAFSRAASSRGTQYNGNISVSNTSTSVDANNAGISSVVTGNGFTKGGTGVLKVSGTNDYTGTTTISGGTLQLGTGTNIPNASALTMSATGTVLDMNGYSETIGSLASASGFGRVTSSSAGSVTLNTGGNGANTEYTGLIEDGLATVLLTKSGGGQFTLSTTANTYSGLTTVSAGILDIRHSASLGSVVGGTSITNGATMYMYNNISVGDESLTINGVGNAGSLRSVSGTNVWGGTLTLASNSTIYVDAGSLTFNPASGSAISSSNFDLTISGAGSSTISGTVSLGTGKLTTNNGTVTLLTGNTYSGLTSVGSGILNVRNNTSLGTSAVTVANGATLQLQGGITVSNALTLNGVGSGGSLRSLSGDNSYNGAITLSTNAVRINTDANSLTINGNINGSSIALYVGGSGNTIMNGVLSGTGGLLTWGISPTQLTVNTSFVKDGTGTVSFVGANTYSGHTVFDAGLLQLGG